MFEPDSGVSFGMRGGEGGKGTFPGGSFVELPGKPRAPAGGVSEGDKRTVGARSVQRQCRNGENSIGATGLDTYQHEIGRGRIYIQLGGVKKGAGPLEPGGRKGRKKGRTCNRPDEIGICFKSTHLSSKKKKGERYNEWGLKGEAALCILTRKA